MGTLRECMHNVVWPQTVNSFNGFFFFIVYYMQGTVLSTRNKVVGTEQSNSLPYWNLCYKSV